MRDKEVIRWQQYRMHPDLSPFKFYVTAMFIIMQRFELSV